MAQPQSPSRPPSRQPVRPAVKPLPRAQPGPLIVTPTKPSTGKFVVGTLVLGALAYGALLIKDFDTKSIPSISDIPPVSVDVPSFDPTKLLSDLKESLKDSISIVSPKIEGPFSVLPDTDTNAMWLGEDARGNVWVVSKYDIHVIQGGAPERPATVLKRELYKALFKRSISAISSAAFVEGGALWTGSWHGELLSFDNGNWKALSPEKEPINGRISGIFSYRGMNYLIGPGLWRADTRRKALDEFPALRSERLNGYTISANNKIFLAGKSGVWSFDGDSARLIWRASPADGAANVVESIGQDTLLVGTNSGVYKLNQQGEQGRKLLEVQNVSAIVPGTQGRLWVGTLSKGIVLLEKGTIVNFGSSQGLPEQTVNSLLVDTHGQLWAALYGEGFLVAKEEVLAGWLRERQ